MDLTSIFMDAFRRREHLFDNNANTAFRLFNGSGDGIRDITIDLYDRFVLVQFFNTDLYREKATISAAMMEAIDKSRMGVEGILLKNRSRVKDTDKIQRLRESELLFGKMPPRQYKVIQNGVKVYVDLLKGQGTGLFLDMRKVRDRLSGIYADGGSMVNFFSYTGQFSVHALANGLDNAVNVDLSRSVLKRAMENYRLNDLAVDDRDFVYGDTIEWIRIFTKKNRRFLFIVFDPPTFARNRKRTFSVQQDYKNTVPHLAPLCVSGESFILTSINSASVSEDDYKTFHPRTWELVFFENEPDDFPWENSPYLKVGLWHPKI